MSSRRSRSVGNLMGNFNQARDRLTDNPQNQKFVRYIVNKFYAPVGGGVKTDAEAAGLVAKLFPGERIYEVMQYIERRMAQLPEREHAC